MSLRVHQITADEVALMESLLTTFGDAFADAETYTARRSSAGDLQNLLGSDSFIALAALKGDEVVGGIAAYELRSSSRSGAKSISATSRWPRRIDEKALPLP